MDSLLETNLSCQSIISKVASLVSILCISLANNHVHTSCYNETYLLNRVFIRCAIIYDGIIPFHMNELSREIKLKNFNNEIFYSFKIFKVKKDYS